MGDTQVRRLVQQPSNSRSARLGLTGGVRSSLLCTQRVRKSARFGNDLVSGLPVGIHLINATTAGGSGRIPIYFGQRTISPTYGEDSKYLSIDPLENPQVLTQPIPVFWWLKNGHPVIVAAGNRRLASYSLAHIPLPPLEWLKIPEDGSIAKRLSQNPILPDGALPSLSVIVRRRGETINVPGSANGVITSRCYKEFDQ